MSEKTISETISEKLSKITENTMCMYETLLEAGKQAEYDRFWDNFQQNGERDIYFYAFAGTGWTEETLKPKYPLKFRSGSIRSAAYTFARLYWDAPNGALFDMTEICKMLDTTNCTYPDGMFQCAYAKNITIDLSNATTLSRTFGAGDGGQIENITVTISEKCTNYYQAFYYQSQIENLIFTEGSVIAASISFDRCRALNRDSVKSILRALKDFTGTGKENTCTVEFHVDVVNQLTEEDIATITQKGWTLVTWTP